MSTVFKGRGAQSNPRNPFHSTYIESTFVEETVARRKVLEVTAKSIVNTNNSPDLPFDHSVNAYQGCEHGCSYCYARSTHEYLGYSAGIDFESQLIAKVNAAQLLSKKLRHPAWKGKTLMFSGNTDCYQPIEQTYELTRKMLEVCLQHDQSVSIITKNALILRDLELLKKMSSKRLVNVIFSITTNDEEIRRKMEPRTSTYQKKLDAIEKLDQTGIPVMVMLAPIIPALNVSSMPDIIKDASLSGARSVSYSIVRLNDVVGEVFRQWLIRQFPERAEKVWNGIKNLHEGSVEEKRFGHRMRGSGQEAKMIDQLFKTVRSKYFASHKISKPDETRFHHLPGSTLF